MHKDKIYWSVYTTYFFKESIYLMQEERKSFNERMRDKYCKLKRLAFPHIIRYLYGDSNSRSPFLMAESILNPAKCKVHYIICFF